MSVKDNEARGGDHCLLGVENKKMSIISTDATEFIHWAKYQSLLILLGPSFTREDTNPSNYSE